MASAERPWEHDTHFCFPCDYVTTDKALMNAHVASAEHLEQARDWPKRLWERFEPENLFTSGLGPLSTNDPGLD